MKIAVDGFEFDFQDLQRLAIRRGFRVWINRNLADTVNRRHDEPQVR
ncbi:MAG: hypothetical protein GY795_38565 [Desulfobacterales bacterium]|nr:hypothetical protein [Desulfobacterales bacterium]